MTGAAEDIPFTDFIQHPTASTRRSRYRAKWVRRAASSAAIVLAGTVPT
jgi:hypothetical protein